MDLDYDATFEAVHGFSPDWREVEEDYPHISETDHLGFSDLPEQSQWDDLCWNLPAGIPFDQL